MEIDLPVPRLITLRLIAIPLLGLALAAGIHGPAGAEEDRVPAPPEMTREYLEDPANITVGKQVWEEQCRHCHGASAYPGKAPKLSPRRYRNRPEFVWDRVANGFRKMPPWKDVYSDDELMGVVAYILSRSFSP